jgi:hypothetical protein
LQAEYAQITKWSIYQGKAEFFLGGKCSAKCSGASLTECVSRRVKAPGQTAGKPNTSFKCRRLRSGNVNAARSARAHAKAVAWIVMAPIATVTTPTAPCRPRLAHVSQRAETASGTAITADSAPMPTIDPIPNSAT